MLRYLIIGITIGYGFYLYKTKKNRFTIPKNPITYDRLYFYCDVLCKKYRDRKISNNIKKLKNDLKYKTLWLDNINSVNNEFYKNISKKKFINISKDINKQKHYCYWVLNNHINNYNDYKVIAFNLKTIYDYEECKLLKKEYLINLSKFCHKHKIIFIIISELHPKIFNIIEIPYFNKNNYISPYHYKTKTFGSIERLPINKISTKAATISINRIILDIKNRYGVDKKTLMYLGDDNIHNINCYKP